MKSEATMPIKLQVIPKETLWGGKVLKEYFNYLSFDCHVGQTKSIICQESCSSYIENGEYKGKNLYYLWTKHQELFQSDKKTFPFIIGLVAPKDNLSIQVHPTKAYAKNHHLSGSKNEAWYFIEAKEEAKIVYGQKAKSKAELLKAIDSNKLLEKVEYKPVKKEDFVYLPAGQLHALCKDVIVYEVQEATDITYRFYDYDRLDENGKKRDIHVKAAMECLELNNYLKKLKYEVLETKEAKLITYIKNNSFVIKRLIVKGEFYFNNEVYHLATIIKGSGKINDLEVKKGDSYLFLY